MVKLDGRKTHRVCFPTWKHSFNGVEMKRITHKLGVSDASREFIPILEVSSPLAGSRWQMSRYIGQYMSMCDLCLRTKIQRQLPTGHLELLPTPDTWWHTVIHCPRFGPDLFGPGSGPNRTHRSWVRSCVRVDRTCIYRFKVQASVNRTWGSNLVWTCLD